MSSEDTNAHGRELCGRRPERTDGNDAVVSPLTLSEWQSGGPPQNVVPT